MGLDKELRAGRTGSQARMITKSLETLYQTQFDVGRMGMNRTRLDDASSTSSLFGSHNLKGETTSIRNSAGGKGNTSQIGGTKEGGHS